MNLKEAFRYQKFLDDISSEACQYISAYENSYKTIKTHKRSAANPEAVDEIEEVTRAGLPSCDDVIDLLTELISYKMTLTTAINCAKSDACVDIDALVESNKIRQRVAKSIQYMLSRSTKQIVTEGRDYKINAEGNQVPYYYKVTTDYVEDFNKDGARHRLKGLRESADLYSAEVDSTLINTEVDFDPPYSVNDSFEDIMERISTGNMETA